MSESRRTNNTLKMEDTTAIVLWISKMKQEFTQERYNLRKILQLFRTEFKRDIHKESLRRLLKVQGIEPSASTANTDGTRKSTTRVVAKILAQFMEKLGEEVPPELRAISNGKPVE